MSLPELRHQDRTSPSRPPSSSLFLPLPPTTKRLTRAPYARLLVFSQVQSGVKEVVYNLAYAMDEESARILKEGGVHLRRLRPGGPAEEAP